ncbi:hypothetical protein KC19_VG004600 [Ceratodon purpureus]|uniref:Uncharacterized protein n=1 Tax=Ceratodon purpureus TaxID=3225 RepID=A0A8T0HKQ6_CERPU|nr:hypothetical protein KC19_VG004600 [Ceratodon purpureus]
MGSFVTSIIPVTYIHGQREVLVQGERNFNRFGVRLDYLPLLSMHLTQPLHNLPKVNVDSQYSGCFFNT